MPVNEETKPSSPEAPAMVAPLVATAAAAAGALSMDLVADAKKGDDDPKIIGTNSHSLEIGDVEMGRQEDDNCLFAWESDESSSSLD
jgi:hypothetical protein